MGNQQSISTTISDTINKTATNIINENSTSCTQNTNLIQQISFSNINAGACGIKIDGLSQDAVQGVNLACIINATNGADIQASFKAALQQQADSKVSGLSGALNSQSISESVSKIVNDVSSNVNMKNLASLLQTTLTTQKIELSNLSGCPIEIKDIRQNAVQTAISKINSSNENLNKIISEASVEISQIASSTNTGIGLPTIFIVIAIMFILGIFIFLSL